MRSCAKSLLIIVEVSQKLNTILVVPSVGLPQVIVFMAVNFVNHGVSFWAWCSMAVTSVGLVLLSALLSMALGSLARIVCKMSKRSPVDQLLPLVVRSNAKPNSWLVALIVVFSRQGFCGEFATKVHGRDASVDGGTVVGAVVLLLIWSGSIARAMVSSIGVRVSGFLGVGPGSTVKAGRVVVEAQVVLFFMIVVVGIGEVRVAPLLVSVPDWIT